MEITQVTTQSANAASGTIRTGTAAAAADNGGADSFHQMLTQVVGGNETEAASADIAAAVAAGIIPASVLMAIAPQTDAAATKELAQQVQQLIAAVQSADPEQLQQLLAHPALQQWLGQAKKSLETTTETATDLVFAGIESSGDTALTGRPVQQQGFGQAVRFNAVSNDSTDSLITGGKLSGNDPIAAHSTVSDDAKELHAVLQRFLQQLQTESTDSSVQKLAADFKTVMDELSKAFPALVVNTERQNDPKLGSVPKAADAAAEVLKADRPLLNVLSANTGKDSGNAAFENNGSQQQFLQRLSFMKPLVHVVSVHNGQAGLTAETFAAESSNGLMAAIDASASDQTAAPLPTFPDALKGTADTAAKASLPTIHAQQFATEMGRFMVKNMSISQLGGVSEAKITLVPEHLGQLDVKISVQNGQITAHFVAESAGARDLLENQLPQLRSALQQQGLQVEKLVVSHNQSLQSGMYQEHRQHQQASQQFSGNGNKSDGSYDQKGAEFSIEMDQAFAVGGLRGYGSSFHASA